MYDKYKSGIISCLKKGKYIMEYCSGFNHGQNFNDDEILIRSIDDDPNSDYWCERFGNDKYLMVSFYFDKRNDKKCFSNGYFYTTNRTLRLSDILYEVRIKKLERIV